MTNVLQWMSLGIGIAVFAWGLVRILNSFWPKPNKPEHNIRGEGDDWRI
jgi:hypothetical protein